MMGGNDFAGWFKAAGKGAGIQTFFSYGNNKHLAPQIAAAGRDNVFVSTGIPCGCCGSDAPKIQPMNTSLAMGYINATLTDLNLSHTDLLLMHHRCRTDAETASVWKALEEVKRAGRAKHIGVSNFNAHDLSMLLATAVEPVEVLEAHFGVGLMDFETLAFANAHNIHPVAFSSLSEMNTDHPTLRPAVDKIAAAHNITTAQALYAYVHSYNITVLSSFSTSHPEYTAQDLAIFGIQLTADEVSALDAVTSGKRSCPDCFTDECQACAAALEQLGCPLGMPLPVWGRDNKNGTKCLACAALPHHKAAVLAACGGTSRGESLETMVPKACGI